MVVNIYVHKTATANAFFQNQFYLAQWIGTKNTKHSVSLIWFDALNNRSKGFSHCVVVAQFLIVVTRYMYINTLSQATSNEFHVV